MNSTVRSNTPPSSGNASFTPEDERLKYGLPHLVVVAIGLFGSLICLFTLCAQPGHSKHKTTLGSIRPLFIGLTMSTLTFSLSSFVNAGVLLTGPRNLLANPANLPWCQAIGFIVNVTVQGDLLQHATIAWHRFFAIVVPPRFAWIRSQYCTAVLVMAPWVISIVSYAFPLAHLGWEIGFNDGLGRCTMTKMRDMRYFNFIKSFFIFFALASLMFCYGGVGLKVAISRRRVAVADRRFAAIKNHGGGVTKTVVSLCVMFLVCFMPSTINAISTIPTAIYLPLGNFLQTVNLLGCAGNPWLILLLTPALRQCLTERLGLCNKKKPESEIRSTKSTSAVPRGPYPRTV